MAAYGLIRHLSRREIIRITKIDHVAITRGHFPVIEWKHHVERNAIWEFVINRRSIFDWQSAPDFSQFKKTHNKILCHFRISWKACIQSTTYL